MSNKNSIIGCGYIPRNVEAVCLKTKREAKLGEVEYKIIAEPYEREWEYTPFNFRLFHTEPTRTEKRMTVNILDASTGLTYAVEYEPANLVRPSVEPKTDKLGGKVEFIDRAQQIIEELNSIFNDKEISEKCGVAFFVNSDNGDGETSSGRCFIGGRGDRIIRSISEPCTQDRQVCDLVNKAAMEATL